MMRFDPITEVTLAMIKDAISKCPHKKDTICKSYGQVGEQACAVCFSFYGGLVFDLINDGKHTEAKDVIKMLMKEGGGTE